MILVLILLLIIVFCLWGSRKRQKKILREAKATRVATEDMAFISTLPPEQRQAALADRRQQRRIAAMVKAVVTIVVVAVVVWMLVASHQDAPSPPADQHVSTVKQPNDAASVLARLRASQGGGK
jgi:fumarate reductase subunit D